jgi:hypothetical protein
MSAKEMFEKLGYKYIENDRGIVYSKSNNDSKLFIAFNKESKSVFKDDINFVSYDIDMQELKAINQQVKELGWLDE